MQVVLRPEASLDAQEARDYYDSQRDGLGRRYLDRVNETLTRIGKFPELHGVVWRNVRAARLRNFNHIVYYRILVDRVEVLAVVHGSRDATVWKSRV